MKKFTAYNDIQGFSEQMLQLALDIKADPYKQKAKGKNKTLALLFFNPSLRTRLSTEKAALNLGMDVMVMNIGQHGWKIEFEDGTVMDLDTQEHIKEAASVVSQYCDILGIRTFPSLTDKEKDYNEIVLNQFLKYATVPVVSLESATLHPLQSFADLITIKEHTRVSKPKVVLTWAPHPKALPQAVPNSFCEWMQKENTEFVIANPEGFNLSPRFINGAKVVHDQKEAFEGAHFIYAKNWSSYENYGAVAKNHSKWVIDQSKMDLTDNGYFMHCLPVRRNVVVTDEVIDSQFSLVTAQANNRTFAAQAVLTKMLENEG